MISKGQFFIPYSQDEIERIVKKVVDEALQEHRNIQFCQNEFDELPLTRQEAMSFLRVKATKFNELRQRGLVIPIRPDGKKTLYLKKDLVALLESCKAMGELGHD